MEAKLRDRLDNLLLENSQLRKKLLAKTEEFCRYKVNVERSNDRTIQSFKEKVNQDTLSLLHDFFSVHLCFYFSRHIKKAMYVLTFCCHH